MQFSNKKSFKLIKYISTFYKLALFIVAILFAPMIHPKTANAGLFSFLTNLTGDPVSAKTVETNPVKNSQNMLVLQTSVNSDQNPNKPISDGPLVSDNALVPEIGPSGTVSDFENDNTNTQISLYVVREGDNLSKIAQMFKVTPNTIIWANDLDRNAVLQKDQKLIILPISGIKYTVKKGDSIKSIVSKYKSDLTEVLQFNDLTLSSTLAIGDTIVIPDAEPTVSEQPRPIISRKIGVNPLHDADGPFYPGYYIRPIDGGYESQGLHGYNAVDLAAPIGTPIHASAEGVVIASMTNNSWNGGYGNYVIISHPNGTQTLYAHTLKNFVKFGDHVEQDQIIAKIGLTGKTTGPHVHFEIRGAKNPF